ncbi:hypothetical protein WJX79_002144 [Trebouxia sp. C0005]
MNGEESGTETYEESDYSSGSDNDMPGESGSSPERSQERRVPKLALGGAILTGSGKSQRFAVPPLGLRSSAVTAEESSAICDRVLSKQLTIGSSCPGSMFSLTAYEEMLNRSKQDRAEAQQSAAALTSLKGLVEEQNQEVSKCSMRIGELERELRGKEEYCNRLQRELAIQRDQLQRSDTRHLEGQKSLQALKAEFDNLSTIVPRRSSLASSSSPLGSGNHAPGLINVRLSSDMRSSSSLSASEGTTQRLVDVLEKLCDEKVLAKLEHLGAIHRGVKSD